jgi:hypothetical protein
MEAENNINRMIYAMKKIKTKSLGKRDKFSIYTSCFIEM